MSRLGKNVVEERGNLGVKPELRVTSNGTPVTNLRLAVNEKRGDSFITSWFDVVVFGKLAELCTVHLDKGSLVEVRGRLRNETFEKNGQVQYRTKIEAKEVDFLSRRPQALDPEAPPQTNN
jgi:single-strand DNA-binding protein